MDVMLIAILVMLLSPILIVLIWSWYSRYYFVIFRTPHYSVKILENMRQVASKRFKLDEEIRFKKYGLFDYPDDIHQIIEIGNIKLLYFDVNAKEGLSLGNSKPLYWHLRRPTPKQISSILENDSMYKMLKRGQKKALNTNDIIFIGVALVIAALVVVFMMKGGTIPKLG